MAERHITTLTLAGLSPANLIALAQAGADGTGNDYRFAPPTKAARKLILSYEGVKVGRIVYAYPTPRSMKVKFYCETNWRELGIEPTYPPCEIMGKVIHYLVRAVEGVAYDEALRLPWE